MGDVTELRVALKVEDFDVALAFYRDALGLEQLADWSSEHGRGVVLEAGRATLELLDEPQAEMVDAIEAGRRGSETVRLTLELTDSEETVRRLGCGGCRAGRTAGDDALGATATSTSGLRTECS
jgi:methylmalonyl-CoA/ethylmalonyl-CoA epimerase